MATSSAPRLSPQRLDAENVPSGRSPSLRAPHLPVRDPIVGLSDSDDDPDSAGTADVVTSGDFAVWLGEVPPLTIRLVVSPGLGRFLPVDNAIMFGEEVRSGQIIGFVKFNTLISICSPFEGVFAGFLAVTGELINKGQAVAWLWEPGPPGQGSSGQTALPNGSFPAVDSSGGRHDRLL
jgi:hypothetical protein